MFSSKEKTKAFLVTVNRILAREGVIDVLGHVSVRSPDDPEKFYLPRSLAPELVTEADILEIDLNSQVVQPADAALYSERVIHGAIYRTRPDARAVCHHHAAALMPPCLANLKLRVVTNLGASIGEQVPDWNQRLEFGITNNLFTTDPQASSLARCVDTESIVLMKR